MVNYSTGPVSPVALEGWFSGLAGRHAAQCNMLCIGDSVMEGQAATFSDRVFTARLRDMLRTRFPTSGLTQAGGGGRGFLTPQLTGATSFTANWVTMTGSPSTFAGWGIDGYAYDISNGNSNTITYALNGTSAVIRYAKRTSGGSFTWAVDGGGATTVSTSAGANADNGTVNVPLGASGPHSLVITYVASSGVCYFEGVTEYNGDEHQGIVVHNAGHFGWTAANWATFLAGSGAAVPGAQLASCTPNLILIRLGNNDFSTGLSPAGYQASMTSLIATLRAAIAAAGGTSPPILLLASQQTSPAPGVWVWSDFVGVMYSLARNDPLISVLDLTQLIPAYSASQQWGFYAADNNHPSDKGHSWMADIVCDFLSPF